MAVVVAVPPAVVVAGTGMEMNVAEIVWSAATPLKMYEVEVATDAPSIDRVPMS